jgi:hypothetical protein
MGINQERQVKIEYISKNTFIWQNKLIEVKWSNNPSVEEIFNHDMKPNQTYQITFKKIPRKTFNNGPRPKTTIIIIRKDEITMNKQAMYEAVLKRMEENKKKSPITDFLLIGQKSPTAKIRIAAYDDGSMEYIIKTKTINNEHYIVDEAEAELDGISYQQRCFLPVWDGEKYRVMVLFRKYTDKLMTYLSKDIKNLDKTIEVTYKIDATTGKKEIGMTAMQEEEIKDPPQDIPLPKKEDIVRAAKIFLKIK